MAAKKSWLAPYIDEPHLDFYRGLTQFLFSLGLFVGGFILVWFGLTNNKETAITLGAGFVGMAVGFWLR